MKIYTKTGDDGSTGLFGGSRVLKDDLRIEAYGTVDELNAHIGMVRDQEGAISQRDTLLIIQDRLFTIGSILAVAPGNEKVKVPSLTATDVEILEKAIDKMDETLPVMKNFILPGGHTTVSACHISRCVCRRAERRVVQLFGKQPGDEQIVHYLNRLSDYLFVLSRFIAVEVGAEETPWIARM